MLVHLGDSARAMTKAKLECESFFEQAGADGSDIAVSTVQDFDDCLDGISSMMRVWEHFIQVVREELEDQANRAH